MGAVNEKLNIIQNMLTDTVEGTLVTERGITGFGSYIPRRRLLREAIAEAHSWAIPGLKALGKGETTKKRWRTHSNGEPAL